MNDAKGSMAAHRGLTVGIIACAVVAVIGVAMLLLAAAGFVTVNVVRRRR